MREKFIFSDGQDLSSESGSGTASTHVWDLEQDDANIEIVTDQMFMGWINLLITAAATVSCTEGLRVELRTEDAAGNTHADNTVDEKTPGGMVINQNDLVAGNAFSFGFCQAELGRYARLFYTAVSTGVGTTLNIEAWFSEHPITMQQIQKRPS